MLNVAFIQFIYRAQI